MLTPSQRVIDALRASIPDISVEGGDTTAAAQVTEPVTAPMEREIEPAGGAVPLGSPFYVERPEDAIAYANFKPNTSFLLLRGPRQAGKTSLMARLLDRARAQGATVLFTDWQKIPQAMLSDHRALLMFVADSICDQLNIECDLTSLFTPPKPPPLAFERFFRRYVLARHDGWVVWGIDEAERLYDCPFRDDIFGMLRSWHNERTVQLDAGWDRLTVPIAYATESYLITNLLQSPFNVGVRIPLTDFTIENIHALNEVYGRPLASVQDFDGLLSLTGGHPYLVRLTLQEMCQRNSDFKSVAQNALAENSIYQDHLQRLRLVLNRDVHLAEAVKRWLNAGELPDTEHFARLTAAGVACGASPSAIRPRCDLYARYLEKML
jgi:AAA-like domain